MSYGRGEAKTIVTPGGVLAGNVVFEEVEDNKSTGYAVKYPNLRDVCLEPFLKVGEHVIYQPLSPCPWTLPPSPKPYGDVGSLWKAVREYVYDHIDFQYDSQYSVYTAWVLANWTLERWDSVCYLWFTGPRNSGKTRALDVLAQLAYRPLLSPSVSASSIYRALDAFHPTFLLDEFEMYEKMKETKAEVIGILNAGYRRGQVVLRTDKVQDGAPILRGFSCFGFKALSSIEELPRALQGRTITFIMSRAVRRVKRLMDKERARELRGMLLQYRFDHLSDPPPSGNPIDIPDGRLIELYTPLVTVAPPEAHDIILGYAKGEYEAAIMEDLNTDEAKAFIAIIDMLREEPRLKISQVDIRAKINESLPEKEQWSRQKTGLRIKKIGLKSRPGASRLLQVVLDRSVLERIAERYTMPEEREAVKDTIQKLQNLQKLQKLEEYTEVVVKGEVAGPPPSTSATSATSVTTVGDLHESVKEGGEWTAEVVVETAKTASDVPPQVPRPTSATSVCDDEKSVVERSLCEECGQELGRPREGGRWLCNSCTGGA